jgi:hypothetical protein
MFIKNKTRKILTVLILVLIFFSACSMMSSADINIELDPEFPKPQDTITFNVTINDTNLNELAIIVEECGYEPEFGYVCYTDKFNETMIKTPTNTYSATIKLKHENATEIKYQLKYHNDTGWFSEPSGIEMVKVSLDINNADEGNLSVEMVYFIIIVAILIIFISLILYRRKR